VEGQDTRMSKFRIDRITDLSNVQVFPHAAISTKQSEHGIFGKVIHRNGRTGEETNRVRHSHRAGLVPDL